MRAALFALALLLAATLPAQWIGERYGVGTAPFSNGCDENPQELWHDANIYAIGSASVGGPGFDYVTVRRNWCPSDLLFLHVVALGSAPANVLLPASVTGTSESWVLTSGDVLAVGTLGPTNVEYSYPQQIPNEPLLIGVHLYSQWMLFWVSLDASTHLMLSQGLVVTVSV